MLLLQGRDIEASLRKRELEHSDKHDSVDCVACVELQKVLLDTHSQHTYPGQPSTAQIVQPPPNASQGVSQMLPQLPRNLPEDRPVLPPLLLTPGTQVFGAGFGGPVSSLNPASAVCGLQHAASVEGTSTAAAAAAAAPSLAPMSPPAVDTPQQNWQQQQQQQISPEWSPAVNLGAHGMPSQQGWCNAAGDGFGGPVTGSLNPAACAASGERHPQHAASVEGTSTAAAAAAATTVFARMSPPALDTPQQNWQQQQQ